MGAGDAWGFRQVCNCQRDTEYADISTRRETQAFCGVFQQGSRRIISLRCCRKNFTVRVGVDASLARRIQRPVALVLPCPGGGDAGADFGGALRRRWQVQVGSRDARRFNAHIDPVQQWARKVGGVVRDAFWLAPAAFDRIVSMTAATGVHRRDQLEPGRISIMTIGAGYDGTSGFQRLAERLQHAAWKFWQFIQKQHAIVGQGYFSRLRTHAAAD